MSISRAFLYASRVVKRYGYIAIRKDRYLAMREELRAYEDIKPLIADGLLASALSMKGQELQREATDMALNEAARRKHALGEIHRAMQRSVDGEIDPAIKNAIIWRVLSRELPGVTSP